MNTTLPFSSHVVKVVYQAKYRIYIVFEKVYVTD